MTPERERDAATAEVGRGAESRTRGVLARFETVHALCLLAAAGLALGARDVRIVAVAGAVSLLVFVLRAHGRWTESGNFGAANTITLARVGGVFVFSWLGARAASPPGALLVLALFALDGVDGWVARRTHTASAFGARLDTECDAWMVLVASLVLQLAGRLGPFILVAGLLRYLYVLALAIVPGARGDEPPSRTGRWAFSLLVASLCASLWPLGPWHAPVAMLAVALLCASFARSVVWSWGPVPK